MYHFGTIMYMVEDDESGFTSIPGAFIGVLLP